MDGGRTTGFWQPQWYWQINLIMHRQTNGATNQPIDECYALSCKLVAVQLANQFEGFVSIWYKKLISLLSTRTLSDSNKAQRAPTSLDKRIFGNTILWYWVLSTVYLYTGANRYIETPFCTCGCPPCGPAPHTGLFHTSKVTSDYEMSSKNYINRNKANNLTCWHKTVWFGQKSCWSVWGGGRCCWMVTGLHPN